MSMMMYVPKNFGFFTHPLCISSYPLWGSPCSPRRFLPHPPSVADPLSVCPSYLSVSLSKIDKKSLICFLKCSLYFNHLSPQNFYNWSNFQIHIRTKWGLESEVYILRNGGPIPRDIFDSTPKVKIKICLFCNCRGSIVAMELYPRIINENIFQNGPKKLLKSWLFQGDLRKAFHIAQEDFVKVSMQHGTCFQN